MYNNLPLFLLGFGQEIKITCGIEYKSKNETSAIHQSATLGIDFETDSKNPFQFPKEISFNVNLQTDFEPKELISNSFENLIERLKNIQEVIKNNASGHLEVVESLKTYIDEKVVEISEKCNKKK